MGKKRDGSTEHNVGVRVVKSLTTLQHYLSRVRDSNGKFKRGIGVHSTWRDG